MNGLSVISRPSTTGIVGSDSWGSDRGIGLLCSNYDETSTRAFMRGGQWTTGGGAGILIYV